jgi:dTDP-4-dehydrorhamnose reductase
MKEILITGANGFLGQHLCRFLSEAGHSIIATGKGERRLPNEINVRYVSADLTNQTEVRELLEKFKPAIILHNAAMSKPDECDNNREQCMLANVESTKTLLAFKPQHFIYISTDFIFGENGPHAEDDQPAPLNFYGESKLKAEQLVKEQSSAYTIVRPVFIYGEAWEGLRGSFLHWVKSNLEQGKKIKVVSDQQRTPTYVKDICTGINTIIRQAMTGVYHLAGPDVLSPYDMAIATAKILSLDDSLIENVTSDSFPEPVKRAKHSGLKIEKARRELGYAPVSFEEGIRRTFEI